MGNLDPSSDADVKYLNENVLAEVVQVTKCEEQMADKSSMCSQYYNGAGDEDVQLDSAINAACRLGDAFQHFWGWYVPVLAGRFLSNAVVDKTAWQQIDDKGGITAEDWLNEIDCCAYSWSPDLPMCQGGAASSGMSASKSAKASAKASAAKASAAKASAAKASASKGE